MYENVRTGGQSDDLSAPTNFSLTANRVFSSLGPEPATIVKGCCIRILRQADHAVIADLFKIVEKWMVIHAILGPGRESFSLLIKRIFQLYMLDGR
jgi:hypothetical protein